ncbi:MscS Mechanosensitive ion channel [Pelobacter propionicus DSM 2379]|uniref:MscS Mechanosensitive ion channel n=2 Tax=Pelobacter propionicus TaxID=29543 RepID=A1AU31_PELPD|nr:MscS Mechanosensitive ion channel [Pelobacter propionicus DSM 2379]
MRLSRQLPLKTGAQRSPDMNSITGRPRLKQLVMLFSTACMILLVTVTTAIAAPAQKKTVDKESPAIQAVPVPVPEAQVELDGKPLFPIKTKVLSLLPEERAKTISIRLLRLVKNPLFHLDSLKVVDNDITSDIVSDDLIIMSVSEADALAEGKPRPQLAREFAGKIRAAMEARNREYSTRSLLFGALYTLLSTLVLIATLSLIRRFFPRLIANIHSWRGSYIRSIRIQSIEVLNEERIVALITSILRSIRLLLLLGLFYLYIPLVLSFFPWTRGMASKLFDYILTPLEKLFHAAVSYLPNIFFLLVILAIAHYTIRLTRFIFSEIEKQTISIPGFFPEWADPSFKITRFLILAFAAVVAFPYLPGSGSPAFRGVSVFLGVLFSLGSTSAVANVVAGVILTYMRAFKLGDRVKIADTMGDVVEKNLLVTRVRTIKNVDITIPNAMVLGSHVVNYSSSSQNYGLILNTTITIGYDAPWRQVHELLISAARATGNILELPAPFVLQTALNDFYVSYEINAYTDKPSVMARTYSELHQNIQDAFNEAGVEIMSPHYSTLRDGNRTTIPDAYLAKDYREPSFRVTRVAGERGGESRATEGKGVRG